MDSEAIANRPPAEAALEATRSDVVEDSGNRDSRHRVWALVLICVAQLMVVLDATIANIALPYVGADLDISPSSLTWIVTGYALAFGGLLLLGGRLGDLYGKRRIFMLGLVVFSGASLLGGLATNEALLLVARGAQGCGAALAAPAALALITTTFPAGGPRTRAMAVYAAMSGVGAAVGLILGGWLTGLGSFAGIEVSGWRLTFLINVPIGLAAALAAPRLLAETRREPGGLDVPGALTGTLGLLGLVFGLTRAGEEAYGWDHVQTLAALGAGVALLALFVAVELRVQHPLLPTRILADQTRAASFAAFTIAPAAMFSMFYFLSLFVQQIVGYSPLRAGFAFLPFSIGIVLGAGVASGLMARVAPRVLAGTGTLMAAVALYMFSRLDIDDSPRAVLGALADRQPAGTGVDYWSELLPWIVVMAIGLGLVFVPLTLTAVHHVRAQDAGIGSGVLNAVQQVGGALGLATLSTVALHTIADRRHDVAPALSAGLEQAGLTPDARLPGTDLTVLEGATFQATFTQGATDALLVGAAMMLAASAIIFAFLRVRANELETDPDTTGCDAAGSDEAGPHKETGSSQANLSTGSPMPTEHGGSWARGGRGLLGELLPPAAAGTLLGAGLVPATTGAANPLANEADNLGRSLLWLNTGWADAWCLLAGTALLVAALLARNGSPRSRVRHGLVIVGIASALLTLDHTPLMVLGYLPFVLVCVATGRTGELDFLLSPGLAVQVVTAAGALALAFRMLRDRVRVPASPAALADADRRTKRWTKIAMEAPLAYAVSRVLMFFHVPGFGTIDGIAAWAGLALGTAAVGGAALTWGLIRPWGERYPRWVPCLAGRAVPTMFPVTFALIVATFVATASRGIATSTLAADRAAIEEVLRWPLVSLPQLLWPLWAVALALAALAYRDRRGIAAETADGSDGALPRVDRRTM